MLQLNLPKLLLRAMRINRPIGGSSDIGRLAPTRRCASPGVSGVPCRAIRSADMLARRVWAGRPVNIGSRWTAMSAGVGGSDFEEERGDGDLLDR
jgi:hypothetical protein